MVACASLAGAQTPYMSRLDPAPQGRLAVAWDPDHQRVVGVESSTTGALWDWDGQRWLRRLGAMGPGVDIFAIGHDPLTHEVLGVGRYDVATWNGARWRVWSAYQGPGLAETDPIAFDTRRRCFVAYRIGGVWEWRDGWRVPTQLTYPPYRIGAAFAYHPGLQATILYGGSNRADCWSWDGANWTQLTASAPPGPRSGATLGYDPSANRLVLYGGQSAGAPTTWTLTGTTWAQMQTVASPGPRVDARMVWDGSGVLLVGGAPTAGEAPWRLQGGAWQSLPEVQPAVHWQGQWAYDPVRGNAVLFSGAVETRLGAQQWADTWTYDRVWQRRSVAAAPAPRIDGGFAWSAANQGILLHGGADARTQNYGDTWLWDGVAWRAMSSASSPGTRTRHVMVEDPSGGVLLFGGADGVVLGDQWLWDGAMWRLVTPLALPSPRHSAYSARHPASNRVLLLGGWSSSWVQDAWAWDGAVWQPVAWPLLPNETPLQLAWRPETTNVLLQSALYRREWDGVGWSLPQALTVPPQGYTLVADKNRGELLGYPVPYFGSGATAGPVGLAVYTGVPASADRYGTGCAIGSAPGMTVRGAPRPGNAGLQLVAGTVTPLVPTMLLVGTGAVGQPLGGGCNQWVSGPAVVTLAIASAGAEAAIALPVPNQASLRGLALTAQIATLDMPRGLYLGLALSEGLRVTIGD